MFWKHTLTDNICEELEKRHKNLTFYVKYGIIKLETNQ